MGATMPSKKKATALHPRLRDHVLARGGVLTVKIGDIMSG